MKRTLLLQRIAITLALLTSLGILVHDTKFDKAISLFTAAPIVLAAGLIAIPQLASEGHNHVERASGEGVRSFQNGMPRIQPRKDKRFGLPKHVAKGVHAFDGYYMPLGQL
ncbi:MAG: hypothetical protein WAS27_00090 [Candidatus Saccharimonadales bacterium]